MKQKNEFKSNSRSQRQRFCIVYHFFHSVRSVRFSFVLSLSVVWENVFVSLLLLVFRLSYDFLLFLKNRLVLCAHLQSKLKASRISWLLLLFFVSF